MKESSGPRWCFVVKLLIKSLLFILQLGTGRFLGSRLFEMHFLLDCALRSLSQSLFEWKIFQHRFRQSFDVEQTTSNFFVQDWLRFTMPYCITILPKSGGDCIVSECLILSFIIVQGFKNTQQFVELIKRKFFTMLSPPSFCYSTITADKANPRGRPHCSIPTSIPFERCLYEVVIMEEHLIMRVPCLVKLQTREVHDPLYATRNMSADNYLARNESGRHCKYVIFWLVSGSIADDRLPGTTSHNSLRPSDAYMRQ